jgi:hypothetical protein
MHTYFIYSALFAIAYIQCDLLAFFVFNHFIFQIYNNFHFLQYVGKDILIDKYGLVRLTLSDLAMCMALGVGFVIIISFLIPILLNIHYVLPYCFLFSFRFQLVFY